LVARVAAGQEQVVEQQEPIGAPLRWARAGVLATIVLVVSTLAHTSAGGELPSGWGLLVLMVITTSVLATVLNRPASRLRVVVLLAGGQAVQHAVMTAATGHTTPTSTHAHVSHHEHGHHHAHADHHSHLEHADASAGPAEAWLRHLQEDLTGPNLWMGLAHLIAAAVLGWWVAAGEQALWSLLLLSATVPACALLLTRAAVLLRRAASGTDEPDRDCAARPVGLWPEHVRPVGAVLLSGAVLRRGPPELLRA
jgi:hypothetical protein